MPTIASQRLLELTLPVGVTVALQSEAVILLIRRDTLEVTVTVPTTVREWFVEANDSANDARVEDWCDYDGYDASSLAEIEHNMATEVLYFVERLLSRELRLGVDERGRTKLIWKVENSWLQALPIYGNFD